MKTKGFGMKFFVCLVAVAVLIGLAGACAGPAETPTTPAPTAPAPTTPAPTTPAPTTPAPTAPAPTGPAPSAPGPAAPAAGPKYGGILRQIVTDEPSGSMGVPQNMRGAGSILKTLTIESLLYQRLDGSIDCVLAESYEWSEDYNTLTLHLRKGVTFHDGTPFNAEAVKWNWDNRTAAHAIGTGDVESTEIIDDYTFAIHLKKYTNSWIDNITSTGQAQTGLIISPTAYETNGEEWANWNPVGTGPYKFKSYDQGQSLEIERYEDYWGEQPYLDGIKFLFIPDAVTAQLAFEAGDGDTFTATGKDKDIAHDLLPKGKGYWAVEGIGLSFELVTSGANPDSPFSKLEVREALEYAIDKEKIVEGLYFGYGIPWYQQPLKVQLPYRPDFVSRKYNPDKARELLAQAGYPNGFKSTLYCQVLLYGRDTDAVQAYLKAVGIDCKLDVISVGKWIEMETFGWADGIMFSPRGSETWRACIERFYIQPLEPNWGRGLWWETLPRTPELERLIQEHMVITDLEEEKAKGIELVDYMVKNAITNPLWQGPGFNIMQPWVKCTDPEGIWFTGGIRGVPIERFWLDK